MQVEIDIKKIRDKAKNLIELQDEESFLKYFDEEGYEDIIENTEDYIVEGLVSYYNNNFIDE